METSNVAASLEKSAGRWKSNVWKKTHINADWRDISDINGHSQQLLDDIKSNPVLDQLC